MNALFFDTLGATFPGVPRVFACASSILLLRCLTEAREMLRSGSEYPLPAYAWDMRPEEEWPTRKKD